MKNREHIYKDMQHRGHSKESYSLGVRVLGREEREVGGKAMFEETRAEFSECYKRHQYRFKKP